MDRSLAHLEPRSNIPSGRLRRFVASAGGLAALIVALAACGRPLVAPTRCEAVTAQPGQRVVVSFRQPTVVDAPAIVEQLQALAGACVRPVSSVSPALHVYVVSGPVDIENVRERWLAWSAVSAVESDGRVDRP